MNDLEIFIDGASKGNPGHSGIGIVIKRDGVILKSIGLYIGLGTNNAAEYTALIQALQEALLLKVQTVQIFSDSQLLCRQMDLSYKVRHENILRLYEQARHLMSGFSKVTITHIGRELNTEADHLATKAVKEALAKKK